MIEGLHCNINSSRSIKARFASKMDKKISRNTLAAINVLCFIGVIWVVFIIGNSFGWLFLIPLSINIIILAWYHGELEELKPTTDLDSVSDLSEVISRRLLAKLKASMTPKDLSEVISTQEGGYFFSARFGVGKTFLIQNSADDEGSSALVWSQALNLAKKSSNKEVDSNDLAGALILSIPEAEPKLATLALDKEDIENGVEWFAHIRRMIRIAKEKNHSGGIGRDLSFGWAPILNHVGFNITEMIQNGGFVHRTVSSRNQNVDQIMRLLAQQGRRNVTLVGEPGVGKTTLVYSLAKKLLTAGNRIPKELAYSQVISLDATNLIASAKAKGQLEELLIKVFNEAIHAKNVIIFLDDAQLFLREGTGSVDLSSLLLPILQGGGLRLILSLSDQEWVKLSQENAGIAQYVNRVAVKPLEHEETIQVIEDEIILLESKNKLVYTYQSIAEAYKLAERFIHEQAFPGKALKLLESAANFPEQTHFVTAKSVKQAVEKSFDVKVQSADSAEERDVLLNLEQKIHGRMINQTRAVTLVSDALRRARSGVRNQNRPIGTFLFLGPTGVGKTELSKALAAVYFGGEERLVRVDLNEYSNINDVNRLLATGSTDPYSLCAQIAKQPFSVVLLDEIEKAHPNVLNVLLQMLDEGVLRDDNNRPISFRDAIIICTSNAGAEKIRAHITEGQDLEDFEDRFIDELINANVFRPEFLNRFDEIVLFRPLKKDELIQLVNLLLNTLNKTLADKKVTVVLSERAKELLAERGYDPRLGARPLRRVMQRAVENIVAQKLLEGGVVPGQQIQLDAPELLKVLDSR